MLTTEAATQINVRQALIQEIDQTSESLLNEVLDFLLFIKAKHSISGDSYYRSKGL